jgi:arginyl-tRNA synthetase
MLIRDELKKILIACLENLKIDIDPQEVVIEQPPKMEMGDYASTLPLTLARKLKQKPVVIAEQIKANISSSIPFVDRIEITPSGYINFFLSRTFLENCLEETLCSARNYISSPTGKGKKVLVEFVSANPTGPITVANARSGPIGDTIATLFEINGYEVEREFYVNDMGAKVAKLSTSVSYQYQKLQGLAVETPEEYYPGDYILEIAQELTPESENAVSSFALEKMLDRAKADLGNLHIHFDSWFRESNLHQGILKDTINQLRNKNCIYEADGATWLRSTEWGDDKDRVLLRSDGSPTYLAGDIAYHRTKFERGYDVLVDIWGADQSHIKPLRWALGILGFDPQKLIIVVFQLVHLFKGGVELKMSKSTGDFISLRELLTEIGPDVTRFIFLTRSNDQHLNFDMDVARSKDPKNPVFYAQYAYTRCKGILREAASQKIMVEENGHLNLLKEPSELKVLRKIALFPDLLQKAYQNYSPHLITYSILELVNDFHAFYENCRVLDPSNLEITKARLSLINGILQLLQTSFELLGIDAPERM